MSEDEVAPATSPDGGLTDPLQEAETPNGKELESKSWLVSLRASPWTAGATGFLLGSSWFFLGLLFGWGVEDTLFAFTIVTVLFAIFFRLIVGLLAALGLALVATGAAVGWKLGGRRFGSYYLWFTAFAIGATLPATLTFILLDETVFLGAFLTVPFVLGTILLAAALGHVLAHPVLGKGRISDIRGAQAPGAALLFAVILLALMLVLPNLTAVMGLEPGPPARPGSGYGSGEMPYGVQSFSREVAYPEEIASWWNEAAEARNWRVHIFLPTDYGMDTIGLAVYLHGYEGEDIDYYEDSMTSLAGQGLVAIFPEYVSEVDYSAVSPDFEVENVMGGTNDPAHLPRYTMALYGLDAALDFLAEDSGLVAALGGATLDTDYLWVGGHSMGGGTALYVTGEALERGWGAESLVVNIEAPWINALQPELRGDLTLLPDHAQIQVIEYESDTVVEECLGRWHHSRMLSRDGSAPLPANQVRFLFIQSDYHGFPPLVASHYQQISFMRDALSNTAYYPRIEAQADYVTAMSQGDSAGGESARAAFMDAGGIALDSGEWSDGTPVEAMVFLDEPLEDESIDWAPCPAD